MYCHADSANILQNVWRQDTESAQECLQHCRLPPPPTPSLHLPPPPPPTTTKTLSRRMQPIIAVLFICREMTTSADAIPYRGIFTPYRKYLSTSGYRNYFATARVVTAPGPRVVDGLLRCKHNYHPHNPLR